MDDVYEVVSRHTGSEGETVYTRCVCGALRVWVRAADPVRTRLVARAAKPARPDLWDGGAADREGERGAHWR